MLVHLTEAWVAALDRAIAARVPAGSTDPGVVVAYRITTSGAPVEYHLRLDASGGRAIWGPAAADVVIETDREVAAAVARGERAAKEAVLAGHITFRGDTTRLLAWRAALQQAAEALAEVAARTDFGDG